MRSAGLRSRLAVRLPGRRNLRRWIGGLHGAQSRPPLHGLFHRRTLALRGKPSPASILSGRHSRHGEDAVLLPGQPQRRHSRQPLRSRRKAVALEHQARRIAPGRRPKGLTDPSRSGGSGEDPGRHPGLRPQRGADTAGRRRAAGTRHHCRGHRQDPGGGGFARQPADALSHSLRLSRPQGDRRQHCLSAVAQSRQLRARRRFVRGGRAERDARSRVL